MSEPTIDATKTCRFPNCERPAVEADAATGRPPEYCDDPDHNRAAAWRARQRQRTQVAGKQTVVDEARPVDAARQRASEIRGQVVEVIEHLGGQLGALVDALTTTGDPDAAEAQIESVTADAAERVAAAEARATRSDSERRRAQAQQAEADAAAEEAQAAADQAQGALEILDQEIRAVRSDLTIASQRASALDVELEQVKAEAAARHTAAQTEIADLAQQLARVTGERDGERSRALTAESARDAAVVTARDATVRAEAESARALRAETDLAGVRDRLDVATAAAGELRAAAAVLTAERDAALRDVDRADAAGERRVTDLRASLESRLEELRAERDAAQAEAREQRTRADLAENRPPAGA